MEHDEQVLTIDYFKWTYPKYARQIFAIPNGAILCDLAEEKRRARMRYLIREGFLEGVSDLFIAVPAAIYGGLFLEMKAKARGANSLTKAQKAFLQDMREAGYSAQWAPGFDAAKDIIDAYMDLLRDAPVYKPITPAPVALLGGDA